MFIYVVPGFQNPRGRRWSVDRRRGLAEIAARFEVPVIEDAPHAELCVDGDAAVDKTGRMMVPLGFHHPPLDC